MPGSRRTKKGQTQTGANSEAKAGETWDKQSGPDKYDGRANTNAGSRGREPGGRWSEAYYDSPPAIISRDNIRKP
jgi:hypothetical protein